LKIGLWLTIPGGQPITEYHYPAMDLPLGNIAWQWIDRWVTLPGNQSTYGHRDLFVSIRLPVIYTRRSTDFWVIIPGNWSITGNRYLAIATKKTFVGEYLRENEKFSQIILGCCSRPKVL